MDGERSNVINFLTFILNVIVKIKTMYERYHANKRQKALMAILVLKQVSLAMTRHPWP